MGPRPHIGVLQVSLNTRRIPTGIVASTRRIAGLRSYDWKFLGPRARVPVLVSRYLDVPASEGALKEWMHGPPSRRCRSPY